MKKDKLKILLCLILIFSIVINSIITSYAIAPLAVFTNPWFIAAAAALTAAGCIFYDDGVAAKAINDFFGSAGDEVRNELSGLAIGESLLISAGLRVALEQFIGGLRENPVYQNGKYTTADFLYSVPTKAQSMSYLWETEDTQDKFREVAFEMDVAGTSGYTDQITIQVRNSLGTTLPVYSSLKYDAGMEQYYHQIRLNNALSGELIYSDYSYPSIGGNYKVIAINGKLEYYYNDELIYSDYASDWKAYRVMTVTHSTGKEVLINNMLVHVYENYANGEVGFQDVNLDDIEGKYVALPKNPATGTQYASLGEAVSADVLNPDSTLIEDAPSVSEGVDFSPVTVILEGISGVVGGIKDAIVSHYEGVSGILGTIGNTLTGIKDTIVQYLGSISQTISQAIINALGVDVAMEGTLKQYKLPDMIFLLLQVLLATLRMTLRAIIYIGTLPFIGADSSGLNGSLIAGIDYIRNMIIPGFGTSVQGVMSGLATILMGMLVVKKARKIYSF